MRAGRVLRPHAALAAAAPRGERLAASVPTNFTSPNPQCRQHSCTRGLWLWSVPLPMKDADGRPANLLLIDCEGIDAVDQGQKHSAEVFSLAVLLSSVFV